MAFSASSARGRTRATIAAAPPSDDRVVLDSLLSVDNEESRPLALMLHWAMVSMRAHWAAMYQTTGERGVLRRVAKASDSAKIGQSMSSPRVVAFPPGATSMAPELIPRGAPCRMLVPPDGQFLYVCTRGPGFIAVFAIGNAGRELSPEQKFDPPARRRSGESGNRGSTLEVRSVLPPWARLTIEHEDTALLAGNTTRVRGIFPHSNCMFQRKHALLTSEPACFE